MGLKNIVPQSLKNYYHYLQSYFTNIAYGFPSEELKIIGVTGTDGKTTTAFMIYSILKEAGYKVGLLTTVKVKIGNKSYDTGFHVTTPDPWLVPKFLREMVNSKLKWAILEVTSHGLDQNRLACITFEKAVYTNITHEHLDYHKTWKSYAAAKAKLIDNLAEGGEVIYNEDERGAKFITKMIKRNKKVLIPVVSRHESITNDVLTRDGVKFDYKIRGKVVPVSIPILGKYNILNAQLAIDVCENLVDSREIIVRALRHFKGIKGRMQIVRKKKPCLVLVDFAHTPNALKKALDSANELKETGKVYIVFGCAGERDVEKRRKMGMIAARRADVVILTSEDPRSQSLHKINDQIMEGALKAKARLVDKFESRKVYNKVKRSYIQERIEEVRSKGRIPVFRFDEHSPNSREDAIELALRSADSDDIVLITGKGHEQSLCFNTTEYPWSDTKAIKRAVERRYKEKKVKRKIITKEK